MMQRRGSRPQADASEERLARDAWRQIPWFFGILWWASPWAVSLNVGLIVVVGLIPAAQLLVLKHLTDAVTVLAAGAEEALSDVLLWVAVLAGVRLAQAGLSAVRDIGRAFLRERAGWRLQQLVVERAGAVALERFEQEEFYNRLQRAQQAATWRSFAIFETLLRGVELIVNVLSFLVLLVGAHVLLPVLLVAGALPTLVSHIRRGRETYRLYRLQTPEQRRADYFVELLTNREAGKELRLYGLGEHLLVMWSEVATRLRLERMQLIVKQQIRLSLPRMAAIASYIGSLVFLVWLALLGRLTIGDIVSLTQASNRFQGQLTQVLRTISQVFEELLYLSDLRDFTQTPAEAGSRKTTALQEGPCTVEFDDVSFAYPGGPTVLKSLSFRLNPGEKVALVGSNGAGKTTLVKLLLGLYMPTSGQIRVNGLDIREIDPESLRQMAAAVFQDYLRYQLTARENIAFGRAERLQDHDRLDASARAGGADAVVDELAHGYDTVLGRYFEGGQDLSGGQWQKLAIARSYFRDAQILVLDEPTAALDPRAELAVFEQFRELAEGKTAIFVSHRMASARIADRILVMDSGHLLEQGHHNELLAAGGAYAQMFNMQARWYRDDLVLDERLFDGDSTSPGDAAAGEMAR